MEKIQSLKQAINFVGVLVFAMHSIGDIKEGT